MPIIACLIRKNAQRKSRSSSQDDLRRWKGRIYGKNSGAKETPPPPITRQYIPCSTHIREASLSLQNKVECCSSKLMENRYDINMFYCAILQRNPYFSGLRIRSSLCFWSFSWKAYSISCKIVGAFGTDRTPI